MGPTYPNNHYGHRKICMKSLRKPNPYSPKKSRPPSSALSETSFGKISALQHYDQQEKLRALRPDMVVVTQEHLRSNPLVYGEFQCVMKHNRGIKVMQNSTVIQESLVRSLQTFNDNFL